MRLQLFRQLTIRKARKKLRSASFTAFLVFIIALSGCALLPSQLEKIAGIATTPNGYAFSPTATVASPLISTAALVKARSKLRVGIRFDAPPLASVAEDGSLVGMDVDISREFARRWLGSPDNVEFIQVTSSSAPRIVEQRQVDFALGGLVHTKLATAHADFGFTYLYDGDALLVRTGAYADVPSLARHSITYIDLASTTSLVDVETANNFTVTLQSSPSYATAIRQLRDGQTDAVIGRWRRLRVESGRDPSLTVLSVIQREPIAIMLPKNDSDWGALVNITFSNLIADGTYERIHRKWFSQLPEVIYPLPESADIQLANLPDRITPRSTLSHIKSTTAVRIGFIAQADSLATLDSKGLATGFEVDLCRELVRRWFQNSELADFRAIPAGDIPGLLRNGTIDMAIGGIAQTQANAKLMDFSAITFQSGLGIAVLTTSNANNLSDLNNKVIGTVLGRTDADTITKVALARKITVATRSYSDLATLVDALRNGETDAIADDQSSLIALATTAKDVRVLTERLSNLPVGIALPRDDSDFKAFINMTLQAMFEDGTYAFIYKKWFDVPPADVEIWPGAATIQTALVAPTSTPLPTLTPVFSALDTPAPGQIPPTSAPPSTPTPAP